MLFANLNFLIFPLGVSLLNDLYTMHKRRTPYGPVCICLPVTFFSTTVTLVHIVNNNSLGYLGSLDTIVAFYILLVALLMSLAMMCCKEHL
jgi:hypothetical protein